MLIGLRAAHNALAADGPGDVRWVNTEPDHHAGDDPGAWVDHAVPQRRGG